MFTWKNTACFRCLFTQHKPPKPDKFGIKFWMACDAATYFVLRAFLYVGTEEKEIEGGEHVTLFMTEP